jgi:hypothetical protein
MRLELEAQGCTLRGDMLGKRGLDGGGIGWDDLPALLWLELGLGVECQSIEERKWIPGVWLYNTLYGTGKGWIGMEQ